LVHCEETEDVEDAITREKQIKGWRRSKKVELIESANPTWSDLSEEWFPVEGIKAGPSLRLYGVYRAPRSGYCESAGVEGRRFASAMVRGRTSREFPHPTTNVDEESSGRWLSSADRRFGY